MTRDEFIGILQKTLAGSLSSSSVGENIRYYQEYIDTQIRTGRSEEAVLIELGDPRLLARTIIDAGKYAGRGEAAPDEVYEDGRTEKESGGKGKVLSIPGWLFAVLAVLIVIVIVGAVFSLLSTLLPIMIPVLCILAVIRFFQNRH